MDVISGSFLWQKDLTPHLQYSNDLPAKADVVIVGGGISAAIIAERLFQDGIEFIVLDKRKAFASSSTLASTAILQYELDSPLIKLGRKIGTKEAALAYQRSFESWRNLTSLAEEFGETIEFARRPALYLASSNEDVKDLKDEKKRLDEENFECSILSSEEISQSYPWKAPLALYHQNSAVVNPVLFTKKIFDRLSGKGIKIFNGVPVRKIESHDGVASLLTGTSQKIIAKKVIVSAGYETSQLLPIPLGRLFSSYAGATYPLHNKHLWKEEAVVWESARPYHYLRTSKHRIIIGGRDSPFRSPFLRDLLLPLKSYSLKKKLKEMVPNTPGKFEFKWAGTFGESEDSLPYLGESPRTKGVYFVLCCGGNGITFSKMASELIAAWVHGKKDELAPLVALGR